MQRPRFLCSRGHFRSPIGNVPKPSQLWQPDTCSTTSCRTSTRNKSRCLLVRTESIPSVAPKLPQHDCWWQVPVQFVRGAPAMQDDAGLWAPCLTSTLHCKLLSRRAKQFNTIAHPALISHTRCTFYAGCHRPSTLPDEFLF